MKKEEAEEYTQALGQVVAGGWRQISLGDRLGVPKALGLSLQEWVQQRLGGYVKLSIAERREAVKELQKDGKTQRQIGEVLGIGIGTVNRDLEIVPNGTKQKNKSQDNQSKLITTVPNGTPLDVFAGLAADGLLRQEADRQEKKQQREKAKEKAKKTRPLPKGKRCLIYADPPWQYDFSPTDSRHIENQYPTATVEEISGHLKLDHIANDCILFMWATAPKLREALTVMEAWGFEYKTNAVWDKEMLGMGYWFRGEHELLLVGTRGNPEPPSEELRVGSVFRFRRTKHSAKPPDMKRILLSLFPHITKSYRLEMYQRGPDSDWPGWGNQCL